MVMTAEYFCTEHWNDILTEAELPGPELVKLLVEVYNVSPEYAELTVGQWLYSDAT